MHEARIEVTEEGADFRVRLINVTDGETELAKETVSGTRLTNGFEEIQFNGAPLNADALEDNYLSHDMLADRRIFGEYLYKLLTPGTIETEWHNLQGQHNSTDDHLATLLEIHSARWQKLPWELIYHDLHLFHHQKHSIGLRYPGGNATQAKYRWPLRMLVIIGCTDQKIESEQEELAIRRAICAFSLHVDLTILKAPITKKEAGDTIKRVRPHIFHFIGHGTSKEGGSLELSQGDKGTEAWKRDEIQALLTGLNPDEIPRIAVFNACQSAGADGVLGDTAIAEAFAKMGCPAIIAMRGDIFGSAASVFAEIFYRELANLGINHPDQAFCRAVREVSDSEDIDQRVWSLPRIYFQGTVKAVFPFEGECRGFEKACRGYEDLKRLRPFIDREEQRFELYHEADSWLEESEPEYQVLLVQGPNFVGKSWFIQALVYVASLRKFRTSYCDFCEKNYDLEGFLDVLRYGTTENADFFTRPLFGTDEVPNLFAEFDSLRGPKETISPRGNEDLKSPLVEAFSRGLKQAADSGSVLLALDHIKNVLPDVWRQYISKPLIEAVVRGNHEGGLGSRLRLVIAADDNEMRSHGLESLLAKRVVLKSLPAAMFNDFVLQYCLYHLKGGADFNDRLKRCRNVVALIAENKVKDGNNWDLNDLPSIYKVIGVS